MLADTNANTTERPMRPFTFVPLTKTPDYPSYIQNSDSLVFHLDSISVDYPL